MPVGVAGLVIGLDQVTKTVVSDAWGPGAGSHRFELLGSLLAFEYIENTGAAFGVFAGQGILLTLVAGAIVGILIWRYLSGGRSSPMLAVSMGLLVGGAVGNLIDRVRLGYVVDFVAVGTFPRFNAADSAVTIGVLLLAWAMSWEEPAAEGELAGVSAQAAPVRRSPMANRYLEGG